MAKKPSLSVRFVDGPCHGTVAPVLDILHPQVVRATLEDNGATRHWHWYEWDGDCYRYVESETKEWPHAVENSEARV